MTLYEELVKRDGRPVREVARAVGVDRWVVEAVRGSDLYQLRLDGRIVVRGNPRVK